MSSDRFRRRLAYEQADGWRIKERGDDWALLHKPNFGTKDGHLLIGVLTVWWTLGLGNVAYALFEYWYDTPTKVLEAGEADERHHDTAPTAATASRSAVDPGDRPIPSSEVDETEAPLAILRQRYARGEIDEVEFERRVERLLETESLDVAARRDRETAIERS